MLFLAPFWSECTVTAPARSVSWAHVHVTSLKKNGTVGGSDGNGSPRLLGPLMSFLHRDDCDHPGRAFRAEGSRDSGWTRCLATVDPEIFPERSVHLPMGCQIARATSGHPSLCRVWCLAGSEDSGCVRPACVAKCSSVFCAPPPPLISMIRIRAGQYRKRALESYTHDTCCYLSLAWPFVDITNQF